MAITLSKLCANTEKMYNMKLLAGSGGMFNTVRWVHMVEDSEVPDFLHGNELVFTTGIGHIGSEWLVDFIKSLRSHNAVGLVINMGPYIRDIPAQVITYCEQNNFPVFSLPWQIHIIDITYDFCRRIIAHEEAEYTVAEAFRNLIFTPGSREGYGPALERAGFHDNSDYRIFAVDFLRDNKSFSAQVLRSNQMKLWRIFARPEHSTAMFMQEGKIIIVRNGCLDSELDNINNSLKRFVSEADINYYIGASESGTGYASVPLLYKQATTSLITAVIENKAVMRYTDIGADRIIFGVENKEILKCFVEDSLGEISRYDAVNGTDFMTVLREYLLCNSSVRAVAEKMNVHRNTVNYKIKQIKEILNTELTQKDKLELMLAFRIKDVTEKIQ